MNKRKRQKPTQMTGPTGQERAFYLFEQDKQSDTKTYIKHFADEGQGSNDLDGDEEGRLWQIANKRATSALLGNEQKE